MTWRSFVAIGLSFTEGLDDLDPITGEPFAAGPTWSRCGWPRSRRTSRTRTSQSAADSSTISSTIKYRPRCTWVPTWSASRLAATMRYAEASRRRATWSPRLDHGCQDAARIRRGRDRFPPRADVTTRLPGQRVILPRVNALNTAVAEVAPSPRRRAGGPLAGRRVPESGAVERGPAAHERVRPPPLTAAHVLRALGVTADPVWTWAHSPPHPPRRCGGPGRARPTSSGRESSRAVGGSAV